MLQYLWLLPVIHFILMFLVSRRRKTIHLMFDLWAIPYLDWFFLPFNYFLALAIIFSWKLFIISLLISLTGTIYLHSQWKPKGDSRKQYFFMDKKGLTPEGWVHFIFMSIEGALIFTALLSKSISFDYIYVMLSLLAYLVPYYLIVKFVRKNRHIRPELPLILIGIIIVLARIAAFFFG